MGENFCLERWVGLFNVLFHIFPFIFSCLYCYKCMVFRKVDEPFFTKEFDGSYCCSGNDLFLLGEFKSWIFLGNETLKNTALSLSLKVILIQILLPLYFLVKLHRSFSSLFYQGTSCSFYYVAQHKCTFLTPLIMASLPPSLSSLLFLTLALILTSVAPAFFTSRQAVDDHQDQPMKIGFQITLNHVDSGGSFTKFERLQQPMKCSIRRL